MGNRYRRWRMDLGAVSVAAGRFAIRHTGIGSDPHIGSQRIDRGCAGNHGGKAAARGNSDDKGNQDEATSDFIEEKVRIRR